MISAATIDSVRGATDLPQLAREYGLKLQNVAGGYVALCCFHTEKTGSLHIHARGERQNSFKCFGCGAGGNVFGFVMKIESITFPKAVEYLADRAGISLVRGHQTRSEHKTDAEDRAMFQWWWQQRWDATRAAMDAELWLLDADDQAGDVEFANSCGRMLRAIEGMTLPMKMNEFRNRVTPEERSEWREDVAWDKGFADAWMSLARGGSA